MWAVIEYTTFKNGEQSHTVEIELEHEEEYYDSPEGTEELKKKVSQAAGLPVGSFKLGDFL